MHRFCSLTITVFHVLSLESESWKLINNIYSIYVTVIHFIYHTVYRMTGFRQAVPLSLLHSYYHGVSFRCLSGLLVHCLSGLLVLFFLRFFDALYFTFLFHCWLVYIFQKLLQKMHGRLISYVSESIHVRNGLFWWSTSP